MILWRLIAFSWRPDHHTSDHGKTIDPLPFLSLYLSMHGSICMHWFMISTSRNAGLSPIHLITSLVYLYHWSRGTSSASEPGSTWPDGTRPQLDPVELCRFVSLSIIKSFRYIVMQTISAWRDLFRNAIKMEIGEVLTFPRLTVPL